MLRSQKHDLPLPRQALVAERLAFLLSGAICQHFVAFWVSEPAVLTTLWRAAQIEVVPVAEQVEMQATLRQAVCPRWVASEQVAHQDRAVNQEVLALRAAYAENARMVAAREAHSAQMDENAAVGLPQVESLVAKTPAAPAPEAS